MRVSPPSSAASRRVPRLWAFLVVGWIVATLALATSWGASPRTRAWLTPRLVSLGLNPEAAAVTHRIVRKCGHALAYAAFALLALAALRGRPRAPGQALSLALGLAVLDESVQSVSVGRGGSPFDVLLDVAAAAVALALAGRRVRSAPAPPEPPAT